MGTELLEKEKLLQLVLNHIPSFVFWKDTQCIYLGCNENFAKSAGLDSPHEIIGKSDYDLPWSKEQSDFFRKIDKAVMESGEAQINFEEPQTISDGSTRWLRTSKVPLFNSQKEVIGILGTYEDITERKLMELELISGNKQLHELNSKLEIINADLEQFAYATSHDLQEPIRMIEGFASLIERKYSVNLDDTGKQYIKYMIEETQRMSTLIGQILSYSEVEKEEEPYEQISFDGLFKEIVHELDVFLKSKNAHIDQRLPSEPITCQPAKIKMLFANLLTNGIKFNKSQAPAIHIDFENQADNWHFKVSDNGIGIENTYGHLIFKPFKRLNNRDEFPGNGIGLSICRRIIELHGGKIWFTENEGHGTTFHFTLSKNLKESIGMIAH
ncbi:MAG: ATP-binding protein [Bacteroidota bacterium]